MLAQWQAWLNILFLVVVGVERWTRRHDVSAAIVADQIKTIQRSVQDLHDKASDYGSKQQEYVGRVSVDIAVLKSELIALKLAVERLQEAGQPSRRHRD